MMNERVRILSGNVLKSGMLLLLLMLVINYNTSYGQVSANGTRRSKVAIIWLQVLQVIASP